MNKLGIFMIFVIVFGAWQTATAQNNNLDMELEVTDEEKIILFSGFVIAILGVFLFLARDIVLRRKTSYDKEELESKKDKTFEKYHSDWGDDYEELGQRRNTKEDKEFRDAANNDELPNYYEIIGVPNDATPEEIKKKFRELAKKTHPDKTKENSEEEMAVLNKAYEILSDKESRERYDRYLKVG
ncbi:DnaJ domain-containing protein [Candidatus Nitrosopumilus sediminis]|uniref:Heat shock protein DnaJ domain-containing protein n=1 Tax=Candidatus Nitrosopumilus sediminis TaxID=1229909 RepID=K0BAU2_9ARCH|nr:DnaJ domain-containing protein [Candidatus Nitrosopumilus sediminis]AFS82609.1 heat shock protein DnaJ domain-containing protein [Candidatus Nitrosopumilus sediminis]